VIRETKKEEEMRILGIGLLVAILLCLSCGDDGGSEPAKPPSVPTGLRAEGALSIIALTWDASTGGALTGYNVYRSTDGIAFAKLNDDPVTLLIYSDTDVDDGVYYSYKVTAVGDAESDYSGVVRQMHGTRLAASYDADCVLAAGALSPYVAEDSVKIAGGDLEIQTGASLYVLDDAVVDFVFDSETPNREIRVYGLLRVEASTASPAKFTAHRTDGPFVDGTGYSLMFFDETEDYNPADGSGTLIQNCYIENLNQGDGAMVVRSCSPRFYNCKISSSKSTGGSYFTIRENTSLTVERCSITKVVIKINTDLRSSGASITKNTCRDGYYSIYFYGSYGPGMVDPGQVAYNDFDGTVHGLYLFQVDAGEIPLGNNYWAGGLPEIVGGAATIDFEPELTAPPADCGPTW
jgi:hypothetical protein